MPKEFRLAAISRIAALFIVAGTAIGLGVNAETDSQGAIELRRWPAVQLRGYGTVAGTSFRRQLPAGPASILQITCQDEEHARILHAKYLSDLALLPGTQTSQLQGNPMIVCIRATGSAEVLAAGQAGNEVYLFQASGENDLALLIRQHPGALSTKMAFRPYEKVPLFLDRWDKFGFRFYYQAAAPAPAAGQRAAPYDYNQDFSFAEQSPLSGLLFWDEAFRADSAIGLMDFPLWDWSIAAAKAHHLPYAINDSAGVPSWVSNRYRDQTMQKMPGYVDIPRPGRPDTTQGRLSWSATTGRSALLGEIQSSVRQLNTSANLVSWLEPDGEIPLNPDDLLADFGPAPDASYRRYLQGKYHDLKALTQRWNGGHASIASWDQVHVPELAYFRGAGRGAIDLKGTWHMSNAADAESDQCLQPMFDDSRWPTIIAPGNDLVKWLPRKPAVFRRTFDVDSQTLQQSSRWWLYIWDLNYTQPAKMAAYLNGAKVGESGIFDHHWAAFEVSGRIHAGSNQVSIRVPDGFLGYRVYLSPQPVIDYPNLGENMNAEWVAFVNWSYSTKIDTVRRGVEMIRQIDPDRQITFMHPDDYADGVKTLALDFGGEFHCTGYMSGFFADLEPMEMRGASLPVSLEPGSPARTVDEFKTMIGLNLSEGVQGLDYFQRITDVLWKSDIRTYFTDHSALIHFFGKFHSPKAEVAEFIDDRAASLTGFPWAADPNVLLGSGYWSWNVSAGLSESFPVDGLSEQDFSRGNAAMYKVILDTNTTIMSDELVAAIETYVRNGGIFITSAQTGRHSPTRPNTWPIERLTGYRVSHIDRNLKGAIPESRPLRPAHQSDVFADQDWNTGVRPNGLSLEKMDRDCQDLMVWPDGKAAIGLRKLGKGCIIEVGVKFTDVGVADRWDGKPGPGDAMWASLYGHLLDHFRITRLPAKLSTARGPVLMRHFLSNNGLYDVWTLWNRSKDEPQTVALEFAAGLLPRTCFEIKNQPTAVAVSHFQGRCSLAHLQLAPLETRIFLTPRQSQAHATEDWFQLQRDWWRGTMPVPSAPPVFHDAFTVDLTQDWRFQPVTGTDSITPLIASQCDDSQWEHRTIGSWGIADHPGVKHAVLRKTFVVPTSWDHGRVRIWLTAPGGPAIPGGSHVYLDGKELSQVGGQVVQNDSTPTLAPNSQHVVAVEVQGDGLLVGIRGLCWLSYQPKPAAVIDMAGAWQASDDYLIYNRTVSFPGHWSGVSAKKDVAIGHEYAGKTILADFSGPPSASTLLINGFAIAHERNWSQRSWQVNITPWVKFDADNEIQFIGTLVGNHDDNTVGHVTIDIYDPGSCP